MSEVQGSVGPAVPEPGMRKAEIPQEGKTPSGTPVTKPVPKGLPGTEQARKLPLPPPPPPPPSSLGERVSAVLMSGQELTPADLEGKDKKELEAALESLESARNCTEVGIRQLLPNLDREATLARFTANIQKIRSALGLPPLTKAPLIPLDQVQASIAGQDLPTLQNTYGRLQKERAACAAGERALPAGKTKDQTLASIDETIVQAQAHLATLLASKLTEGQGDLKEFFSLLASIHPPVAPDIKKSLLEDLQTVCTSGAMQMNKLQQELEQLWPLFESEDLKTLSQNVGLSGEACLAIEACVRDFANMEQIFDGKDEKLKDLSDEGMRRFSAIVMDQAKEEDLQALKAEVKKRPGLGDLVETIDRKLAEVESREAPPVAAARPRAESAPAAMGGGVSTQSVNDLQAIAQRLGKDQKIVLKDGKFSTAARETGIKKYFSEILGRGTGWSPEAKDAANGFLTQMLALAATGDEATKEQLKGMLQNLAESEWFHGVVQHYPEVGNLFFEAAAALLGEDLTLWKKLTLALKGLIPQVPEKVRSSMLIPEGSPSPARPKITDEDLAKLSTTLENERRSTDDVFSVADQIEERRRSTASSDVAMKESLKDLRTRCDTELVTICKNCLSNDKEELKEKAQADFFAALRRVSPDKREGVVRDVKEANQFIAFVAHLTPPISPSDQILLREMLAGIGTRFPTLQPNDLLQCLSLLCHSGSDIMKLETLKNFTDYQKFAKDYAVQQIARITGKTAQEVGQSFDGVVRGIDEKALIKMAWSDLHEFSFAVSQMGEQGNRTTMEARVGAALVKKPSEMSLTQIRTAVEGLKEKKTQLTMGAQGVAVPTPKAMRDRPPEIGQNDVRSAVTLLASMRQEALRDLRTKKSLQPFLNTIATNPWFRQVAETSDEVRSAFLDASMAILPPATSNSAAFTALKEACEAESAIKGQIEAHITASEKTEAKKTAATEQKKKIDERIRALPEVLTQQKLEELRIEIDALEGNTEVTTEEMETFRQTLKEKRVLFAQQVVARATGQRPEELKETWSNFIEGIDSSAFSQMEWSEISDLEYAATAMEDETRKKHVSENIKAAKKTKALLSAVTPSARRDTDVPEGIPLATEYNMIFDFSSDTTARIAPYFKNREELFAALDDLAAVVTGDQAGALSALVAKLLLEQKNLPEAAARTEKVNARITSIMKKLEKASPGSAQGITQALNQELPPIRTLTTEESPLRFQDQQPKAVADDLQKIFEARFLSINMAEISLMPAAQAFSTYSQSYNQLTFLARKDILSAKNDEERETKMNFWIQVAKESKELGSLDVVSAIVNALNSFGDMPTRDLQKRFDELNTLMSPSSNFRQAVEFQRQRLGEKKLTIPLLTGVLNEAVLTEENNVGHDKAELDHRRSEQMAQFVQLFSANPQDLTLSTDVLNSLDQAQPCELVDVKVDQLKRAGSKRIANEIRGLPGKFSELDKLQISEEVQSVIDLEGNWTLEGEKLVQKENPDSSSPITKLRDSYSKTVMEPATASVQKLASASDEAIEEIITISKHLTPKSRDALKRQIDALDIAEDIKQEAKRAVDRPLTYALSLVETLKDPQLSPDTRQRTLARLNSVAVHLPNEDTKKSVLRALMKLPPEAGTIEEIRKQLPALQGIKL